MGGLHRLFNHRYQFLTQLLQVYLIAQGGTKSGKHLGRVVLVPVEATVDKGLDASSQWVEESCNHEGRGDNQEGVIPYLSCQSMREGLQGKDEANVDQSKNTGQGATDERAIDEHVDIVEAVAQNSDPKGERKREIEQVPNTGANRCRQRASLTKCGHEELKERRDAHHE